MIDEDLRKLATVEDRLSSHARARLKERIMESITTDTASTVPEPVEATPTGHPRPARRHAKRRLVGGVIAATVAVTGTAAAATVWLGGPDPEQAAEVTEQVTDPVAEIYDGAWRPSLRAESVACIGSDSRRLTDPRETDNTSASEFPLAEDLTRDRLIDECATGNDWARSLGGYDIADATACVREGANPLAVVALDELTCEETGDGIRTMTDEDLVRLNQMRGFEVAVLANPEPCPTREQATDWTRTQITHRDEDLTVRTSLDGPDEPGVCFRGLTMWEQGEVLVEWYSRPADPVIGD